MNNKNDLPIGLITSHDLLVTMQDDDLRFASDLGDGIMDTRTTTLHHSGRYYRQMAQMDYEGRTA